MFRSCKVNGTLALTFDDGPSEWTSDLLDILKANDVKATFYLTGHNLAKGMIHNPATGFPDTIRRIYNEGHQIAAHTWSHMDMNELTSQERHDEMVKLEIALSEVLGFFPTYWRPPYNSCGLGCQKDMGALGYHVVSWDRID
jgi:peptidoglycan/xylan/chitin deacetylase (PgdA/CDA1 family)